MFLHKRIDARDRRLMVASVDGFRGCRHHALHIGQRDTDANRANINAQNTPICWISDAHVTFPIPNSQFLLLPFFHLFEQFGLVVSVEGIDHFLKAALHDGVEAVERQADTVVGESILGEVIGSDSLGTIP